MKFHIIYGGFVKRDFLVCKKNKLNNSVRNNKNMFYDILVRTIFCDGSSMDLFFCVLKIKEPKCRSPPASQFKKRIDWRKENEKTF